MIRNVWNIRQSIGNGVLGLDSISHTHERYVNVLGSCVLRGFSFYLNFILFNNYTESRRNYFYNGLVGFLSVYNPKFTSKVLYYIWLREYCIKIFHFYGYIGCFWCSVLLEHNLYLALLTKMTISLIWNLDWRLLRNDWFSGSVLNDGPRWCKFDFHGFAELLNAVVVWWL